MHKSGHDYNSLGRDGMIAGPRAGAHLKIQPFHLHCVYREALCSGQTFIIIYLTFFFSHLLQIFYLLLIIFYYLTPPCTFLCVKSPQTSWEYHVLISFIEVQDFQQSKTNLLISQTHTLLPLIHTTYFLCTWSASGTINTSRLSGLLSLESRLFFFSFFFSLTEKQGENISHPERRNKRGGGGGGGDADGQVLFRLSLLLARCHGHRLSLFARLLN